MRRKKSYGLGRVTKAPRGSKGQWQIDWVDASGKRHRKIVGANKQAAERLLVEKVREREMILAGIGQEVAQDLTLDKIIEYYLDDLANRCSIAHLETSTRLISSTLSAMGVVSLRDLNANRLLDYVRKRKAEGKSNRTVNLAVGTVRSMLKWAARCSLITSDPLPYFPPLPTGKAYQVVNRRSLSEDQIASLLEASREDDARLESPRVIVNSKLSRARKKSRSKAKVIPRVPQTPLWTTFIETGARFNELTRVTWADIDLESGTITLRAQTTKSKKTKCLPIRPHLISLLRGLTEAHHRVTGRLPRSLDPVFLSPSGKSLFEKGRNRGARKILYRLLEAAGIPRFDESGKKIDIHALRHTFATRMARSGAPLQTTQKAMGHSTPQMTAQVYTHLDIEDIREQVQKLPTHQRATSDDAKLGAKSAIQSTERIPPNSALPTSRLRTGTYDGPIADFGGEYHLIEHPQSTR